MSKPAGLRLPLSLPRRLICDYLHFAQQIPSVPVQRRIHIPELVATRASANPRPSWSALFTKAYAFVSNAWPQLRRAYMSFPWPHLYEHAESVATLAIERELAGESMVLFVHMRRPEERSLIDIDAKIREYKEKPLETIAAFRRLVRLTRFPRPLRRLLWWTGLNVWGRHRAHFAGTYGVTTYSGLGASSLHPLSLLTTTMNYGVIGSDGSVDVRLVYDHRVLDGSTVARVLVDLERALNHEVLAELRYFQSLNAA